MSRTMDQTTAFYSCNLCFNPLSKQKNISSLKTLSQVVKTCIGPKGKLKIIQNISGAHTTITSSSHRLFPCLSVKNNFSKLIISRVKSQLQSHKDGGLQCAFFTLSLLQRSSTCDIPLPLLSVSYEHFTKTLTDCFKLEDNSCISKIDFSDLKILQSIVTTVLSSKPGCLLSQDGKNYLCKLLLEAFLNIFPTTSTVLSNYNIRLLAVEGNHVKESKLFNGLLISVPKIDWMLCPKPVYSSAKVALFSMSLSGDVDLPAQKFTTPNSFSVSEAILKHLKGIILKLISEGTDLIFCQKVVHPSLKKQLNDAGIAVFDQLGSETTTYFQYILGGSVNSSLFAKLSFGEVSCKKEEIGKKHYLLIQNETLPFNSVLVYNYNEEALLELKVVCQQVLATLFQLLKNPFICSGAGCTEINSAIILSKKVNINLKETADSLGCTNSKVLSALQLFLLSLVDVAVSVHQRSHLDFVFNHSVGHLWKLCDGNYPAENDMCACGRLSASSLYSQQWHFLSDLGHVQTDFDSSLLNEDSQFSGPFIFDILDTKINSITRGSEVATMILKTELCIFCGTPPSQQ